MRPYLTTIILLSLSNVFMTFAWYGHLKNLSGKPWIIAALVSLGNRTVRIPAASPRESHRCNGHVSRSAQDSSRSDRAVRLRSVLVSLLERETLARLLVGGALHSRRRLFHFSPTLERVNRYLPNRISAFSLRINKSPSTTAGLAIKRPSPTNSFLASS